MLPLPYILYSRLKCNIGIVKRPECDTDMLWYVNIPLWYIDTCTCVYTCSMSVSQSCLGSSYASMPALAYSKIPFPHYYACVVHEQHKERGSCRPPLVSSVQQKNKQWTRVKAFSYVEVGITVPRRNKGSVCRK